MPLIKSNPSGQAAVQLKMELQVQDRQSMKSLKQEKGSRFENLEELDGEILGNDMEGSFLNQRSNAPPSLPQRSEKRASRLLAEVMVDLSTMEGSKHKGAGQQVEVSDPHEQYLSSEEDISFSDYDDDLDSLTEFESSPEVGTDERSSPPGSRGSSRKSQEDTARVVSFVIVGKPQIVNIQLPSPQKRKSHPIDLGISLKPSPLRIHSSSAVRRLSISSTSSSPYGAMSRLQTMPFASSASLPSTAQTTKKPARQTSNLSSLNTNTKHTFLATDPFPQVSTPENSSGTPSSPIPKTPKTPISMAAAAWKTSISRTLSIARKTSSQNISRSQTSAIIAHEQSLVSYSEEGDEGNHQQQRQRSSTTPQTSSEGAVRLDRPTKDRTYSLGMHSLGRRKGMRGRSDRYIG